MPEHHKFDIAVIGAGPGGYVAAIKSAQMGKKVALIEKQDPGGTCLNVGCIPSKALLSNAELFRKIKEAEEYGIKVKNVTFDYSKMYARKNHVVTQLRTSLTRLIKAHGITLFHGEATFKTPQQLKITGKNHHEIYAKNIIIATGSEPIDIPTFPCDHKNILNSTSALELKHLPTSIAIIGGGYIGCEFASLFSTFGVKVVIIESLPTIVWNQGKKIAQILTQAFKQKGIEIRTQSTVESIEQTSQSLALQLNNDEKVNVEKALISVGRAINIQGLGLEKMGINQDPKGAILVNERMETNVPGIYAIGDVTAISMLAHVASHQGMVAAANACGLNTTIQYQAIPAVIFTHPEIASVGFTPEQAQKKGIEYSVGTFPFQALGKSIASIETQGFTQILTDKITGAIIGAHVVGHGASTLIAEMTLAINNELTIDCIIDTIHAHPTISEAWMEAALLAKNTPLHFPPHPKQGASS